MSTAIRCMARTAPTARAATPAITVMGCRMAKTIGLNEEVIGGQLRPGIAPLNESRRPGDTLPIARGVPVQNWRAIPPEEIRRKGVTVSKMRGDQTGADEPVPK